MALQVLCREEPSSRVVPDFCMGTAVLLQRSSDGFTVAIEDSEDVHIPLTDVVRSRCLSTSYDACSIGDCVPLGLRAQLLLEWHHFAAASGSNNANDCEARYTLATLIRVVEVSGPDL